MTVSNTTASVTHTGNGIATSFPFSFKIPTGMLSVARITIATGAETALVDGVDYSVIGLDDENGGSVTFPLSGSPMASTHQLRIKRVVPFTQSLDYTNQSSHAPTSLEAQLDKIVWMIQQVDGELDAFDAAAILAAAASAAAAAAVVAATGLNVRARVATTANITIATALNSGDTIDGVTLADGDIVLVKDQSAPAENGIYTVAATPARTSGYTLYNSIANQLFHVSEGTVNADSTWRCTSNAGGTIDVTALTFASLLPVGSTDNALVRADGTSGTKVQSSAVTVADNGDMTIPSTDAGAAAGPNLTLDRNSASPAASDVLGDLIFSGRDSGGNATTYGDLLARILDPTNGSEDGVLALRIMIAGTLTEMMTLGNSEGGVVELPRGRLKFPASQVSSSDANTLDDYEEGTWTPGVAFGGAAVGVTYGSQTGRYIKIGRFVFASFSLGLTSNGSSTGNFQITGLPFTTDTAPSGAGVIETYNNFATVAREMILDVSPSDTILQFREGTAASAASNITEADVTDTAAITAHVFYLVP